MESKRIGVFTGDAYLFQKIRLELIGAAETILLDKDSGTVGYDLILTDADDAELSDKPGLKMSRSREADISLPFRLGSLRSLLGEKSDAPVKISDEKRTVSAFGRIVKLTELEYSLFTLLYSAGGEYVSREEILHSVWDNRADKGIINVYVHYLREKLEWTGERIILSSRSLGYKINEKFTGGKGNA